MTGTRALAEHGPTLGPLLLDGQGAAPSAASARRKSGGGDYRRPARPLAYDMRPRGRRAGADHRLGADLAQCRLQL